MFYDKINHIDIQHKITFVLLTAEDFPLLLTWLSMPHVKAWWDSEVVWTSEFINTKYTSYVKGYTSVGTVNKPIHAYIIRYDNHPIGYIQYYNAHSFPREENILLDTLPASCAALDFYVGEPASLGKGLGAVILKLFLLHHVWSQYETCLVDPHQKNVAAIRTYEKAGFKTYLRIDHHYLMILKKDNGR